MCRAVEVLCPGELCRQPMGWYITEYCPKAAPDGRVDPVTMSGNSRSATSLGTTPDVTAALKKRKQRLDLQDMAAVTGAATYSKNNLPSTSLAPSPITLSALSAPTRPPPHGLQSTLTGRTTVWPSLPSPRQMSTATARSGAPPVFVVAHRRRKRGQTSAQPSSSPVVRQAASSVGPLHHGLEPNAHMRHIPPGSGQSGNTVNLPGSEDPRTPLIQEQSSQVSTTSSSHSPVSQRETRSVFTSSGLKIHECIPTNSSMATQEPSQASQTILLSSSPRLPPAALLSSSPPSGDPVVRARSPPSRASNRPHPLKSPATVCISDLQRIAGTLQGRLSSATRRVRSDGSLYQRPHGTPVMAYRHSSTSILHSQAGPSALPHKPRTERYQCQNPSPAAHPATPFLHLVPEETYNVGLPQFASFTSGCGIPEKVGTRHSTRKCAECVAYRAEAWFAIDRSQGYERYLELYGDNIPKGLTLLQRRMLKQWKEKRKHDKHLQQEGDDVHQYGDGKRATAAELRAAQLVTPANQQRPSGFSLVSSPSSGLAEGSAVNDSANMLPGAHLQVQRPTAELRTCLRQRHEHLPRQPVRVGDVNMVASEFDIALHGFPVSNARTEEQMAALYRNVDPVEGFTNPYRLPKNKDAGHIASGLLPLLQQLQPSTRAESVGVDVIPLQLPRPTPGPLPYAFDVSYHGGPHSQRHYRPFLHAASASLTLSRAIPMNISTTVNQPSNNAGVMVGQPEPRPPPHTWTAPGDPSEQSFASDYSTSSSTDVDPDSTIRITVPGSYVCGPEDGGSNGNLRVSQGPTRLPDLFVNLRAIPSTGGTCGPNANSAAGAGTGRAVRRRPLPSRGGRVHQRPPLRKIAPRPTGVIKTTAGGTVKQDRSFLRPDPAGTVGVSAAYAGRISTDASHVQTLGYINNAPTQPDYTGRGGDNCRVNAQQVLDSSSSETTEDDSRDNTDGTVDTLCVALATSSAATAGFATSREVVLATTMRGAPNTGGTEEPQATTLAPFDVDWDSDIDADSESGPDTQQKSLVTKSRDKKRKEPPSPRAGPTVTTTATKSFSDGNVHAVYSTDCRKIRAVASGP